MNYGFYVTISTGEDSGHEGWAQVSLDPDRYGYSGSSVRGVVADDPKSIAKFVADNYSTVLDLARIKAEREAAEEAAATASEGDE